MDKDYNKRLQWFKDRVGKRIYREEVDCKCPSCISVGNHGLVILDEMYAHYLNDCSFEMNIEYCDEK